MVKENDPISPPSSPSSPPLSTAHSAAPVSPLSGSPSSISFPSISHTPLSSLSAHLTRSGPLTTDFTKLYGPGSAGDTVARQLAHHLICWIAADIRKTRQRMTGARAVKDHQLRSMVGGLEHQVKELRGQIHPS
ncbi:MAG: hypothetical protein AAF213_01875 [Pseudomonadota bacterium]